MIKFLVTGLLPDRQRSLFPILIVTIGVWITVFFHAYLTGVMGESVDSTEISATPGNPPSAPTNLIATGEPNQISLSWTTSVSDLPVTSYSVKRGLVSGEYTDTFSAGTDTGYVDLTVSNGITY